MNGKGSAISIIFLLLLLSGIRVSSASDNFPFHQEVDIDASDDMLYQPVDMNIHFTRPCWAEDEESNSIRMMYDDGSRIKEIESQVYNLHHTDSNHVDSCNIVFLLQGEGKYYVYYGSEQTPPRRYADHVGISDESYYYEPIPGYGIRLNYYRVEQDGYCIYGIGQEGMFFGLDISQKVMKQIDGKREFRAFNWGQVASFAFFWYEGEDKGTDEKLISKKIMVDGNLMVRASITSMSSDEKVKTSAVYTYYYSPSKERRIMADVKHDVMKECKIYGMEEDDGLYAYLLTIRVSSSSIPDLNFGYIPPYIHINAEDGTVHEYRINQNPESPDYDWILSAKDDIDLGSNPWFSIDDGKSGKAHALIFKNTSNGIQISVTERQEINIPGLEADGVGVNGGRNSYEAGGKHILSIPAGFTVKFAAEFFSSPDGGLPSVKREADIYHRLVPYRTAGETENGSGGGAGRKSYSLTVFPRLAPSIPFSSAFSVITGRKLPSLRVELWRNGSAIYSAACGRLPFAVSPDGRISFDWRNFTIAKKAFFPDVREGEYIIKVFRGGKYVGAKDILIDRDESVKVVCGFEGKVSLNVIDQNGNGIENVHVFLEKDGVIYSGNFTDGNGKAVIHAPSPCGYSLKVVYRGLLIHDEDIRLPTFREIETEANVNDLIVRVTDKLGLPPGVEIDPFVTSSSMKQKTIIHGEMVSRDEYVFRKLPSADYTVTIEYKSFTASRDVSLPDETEIDMVFPVIYSLEIHPLNSRGMKLGETDILLERGGMDVTGTDVPPGNYEVVIKKGGNTIGEREIFIMDDTEIDMVTTENPSFPAILSALVIAIAAFAILLKKPSLSHILMIAAVAMLLLSLLYPWWHMEGRGEGMTITTSVYLIPAKMVTIGRADGFMNGEVASMPSLFGTMLLSVAFLSLSSAVAAVISIKSKWIASIAIMAALSAVIVFSYGMSRTGAAMTGSFWGSGSISISIPGSSISMIPCGWSPAGGYYLSIAAMILMILPLATSFPKVLKRE